MGTATIHDDLGKLTGHDVSDIQRAAGDWPFDTQVLIVSAESSNRLDDMAHNAITNPHVVAIAVDPPHHHTSVRFGTATGVKAGDYDSITKAGSAHFRSGEFGAGIVAIGTRAEGSSKAHVAMAQSNEPVIVEHGWSAGTWFVFILVFGAAITGLAFLFRRWRKAQQRIEADLAETRDQASQLLTRNIEEGSWMNRFKENQAAAKKDDVTYTVRGPNLATQAIPRPAPAYVPGEREIPTAAPSTVVIERGSSTDDLLTGMIIGESMNRPLSPLTRVEYDDGPYRPRYDPPARVERSSSSDSGGWFGSSSGSSSSKSDDSGSNDSWSSSDSGGSDSSWSSSDSGSSGGDWGGGSDGGGGSDSW